MKGAPRRRFAVILLCLFVAVDTVFLNLARGNFGKAHFAEEGVKMKVHTPLVAGDILGIALSLGYDLVFAQELRGGFFEGFFFLDFATTEFALKLEIPVFREVLGLGEAFFVGADPPVFASFVG
jgi:hypothetical protein